MKQYCVYTRDPQFREIVTWLKDNKVKFELHLNRTRFWLSEGVTMTEFLLKWQDVCPHVPESDNYALC